MRAVHLAPLVLSAAVAVGFVACKEDDRYIYTGQKWNADQACLEDDTPIEAVPGNEVNPKCGPTCFTANDALYVSTLCGGLPSIAKPVDAADPACKQAIGAFFKGASCSASPDASADSAAADTGPEPDDAGDGG